MRLFPILFTSTLIKDVVTYIYPDGAAVIGVPRHVTGMLKLIIPLDQGVVTHYDVWIGWLVAPGFTEVILFYQFFLQMHGGQVIYLLPNARLCCSHIYFLYKLSLAKEETKCNTSQLLTSKGYLICTYIPNARLLCT